jgi:putative FmdB family regulatory protein
MPIYEFECEGCGARFEELVAAGAAVACPSCGAEPARRLYSEVRADESRRGEREAARQDRMAESRKRRARGEKP